MLLGCKVRETARERESESKRDKGHLILIIGFTEKCTEKFKKV
jgi:hypothetical protein